MYLELAAGAYLLGSYVYHRWFEDPPPKPAPARFIELPRTDDGARVPLIYGRCRIRTPWLAYVGAPTATRAEDLLDPSETGGSPFLYTMDMFFVMGIPFSADGDNRIRHVWVDDFKMRGGDLVDLLGDGSDLSRTVDNFTGVTPSGGFIGGQLEWYNGNPAQQLCLPGAPFTGTTGAGVRMAATVGSGALVPGYRNYLTVFLFDNVDQWSIGSEPRPGAYSFEAQSFPSSAQTVVITPGEFGPAPTPRMGDEMNPADVLKNVLTGTFGKGNVLVAKINAASFAAAGLTLFNEGIGYSRAVADAESPGDVVDEIMRLTDGLIFEDPGTGEWHYKLVRADYDPNTVPLITVDNCRTVTKYAAGSRANIVNKVRVVWTDRDRDYQDNSVTAQNQASASSQGGGSPIETVLRYPACCTAAAASTILSRELSARSRPLAKFRAIVDRTFLNTNPGDVVALTWPKYNLDGVLFRVAAVERGTREDAEISLDLIQEYFTQRRGVVSGLAPLEGFPFGGVVLG